MVATHQLKIREYASVLLIMTAGFALRFIHIDRWPLWNDEGLTLLFAQWPLNVLFFWPVDTMPGLYYSIHKLLLGPSVTAAEARAISLVCGTLLIPATYFCAKAARVPALLSSLLVGLSFWLIDYSQEARSYSLLLLLVVLSAAFFIRWTRDPHLGDLLISASLNLFAFYTHPVSVFWTGPISVAILWLGKRQALMPLLLTAILAAPEAWRVTHFPQEDFYWLLQASPREAFETMAGAVLPFQFSGPFAAATALLLLWRGWVHQSQLRQWGSDNRGAAIALSVLVGSPILIWLTGYVAKPIFMIRTILIAVPGFLMILSLLLKLEHRIARLAVAGLYAASLMVTGTTRPKEEWQSIAQRVGGDTILMCQPRQTAAMRHALVGTNRFILLYDDGPADIGQIQSLTDLFDKLSSKERMAEAKRRGRSADLNLKSVWAVRSGTAGQLAETSQTLGQAIATCKANRADSAPAYKAN